MTYEEARRRARQRFGANGDVRETRPQPLLRLYEVGVMVGSVFVSIGAGASWEAAFDSVKPVEPKETNEA